MTRSAVVRLAAAIAVLPVTLGAAPPPSPEPSATGDLPEGSELAFHLEDPSIAESSGLAASQRHDGVYWTHNDSGDQYGPDLYAIGADGRTLATITLSGSGVESRDWEAVAVGTDDAGEPAIYVGDIGDNFQGGWPNVRVYRLPEPARLTDQTVEATTFTFTYADGGRDAEGMMVDPRDGRLYVISKEIAGGVYAAPERLSAEGTNELTRVGSAPLYATDAAFAPDGSHYAVRTYWGATLYDASEGVPGDIVDRVSLPELDQGESLSYTADGTALMAGTEGARSPVWRVPLPAEGGTGPEAEETVSATPPAESAEDEEGGASAFILGGIGVAAVVIGGIVLLARRG
ncbi:hypothetical protein HDA32_000309 [Spinactinospora alkalitolerans]|uniref:WD40 repeat domain-containing protein n=1 Tax=Spinactinospora alkalitolerans TaxID=687207 RepID=A0A852TMM2_9ACTN|nr:hypothetical protein [Spinactinospora alkalitolerans]NYE45189.1 hypothetical protein [Spinactinospora alkalitolerans]